MEMAQSLRAACSAAWLPSQGKHFSISPVWTSVYACCLSSSHHAPLKSLSLSSSWPPIVILTARPQCIEWVIHSAVNLSMPRPVPCTRGSTTPTALSSESAARVHESIVSVLTVGMINFLRKCYNSLNDWKKRISTMDGVCMACRTWFEVLFNARPLRIPSIWKDVSLSMLFSSYSISCNK